MAVLLLVAACTAANGSAGSPASGDQAAAHATIGQPAPPIQGTTLGGSTLDLAAYRGHPVVVNFWASWCTPCRDEFPVFLDRLSTLGPSDGLVIIGVLYQDQPEPARQFVGQTGATWPTVIDPGGAIAAAYRVVAPPQTYFIDRDGVLRGMQIGQVLPQDFATQYAKIAP